MRNYNTVLGKINLIGSFDLKEIQPAGQVGHVKRMLVAVTGLSAHLLAKHIGQDDFESFQPDV